MTATTKRSVGRRTGIRLRRRAPLVTVTAVAALTLSVTNCSGGHPKVYVFGPPHKAGAVCGASLNAEAARDLMQITGTDTFFEDDTDVRSMTRDLRSLELRARDSTKGESLRCVIATRNPKARSETIGAVVSLGWMRGGKWPMPPPTATPTDSYYKNEYTYYAMGSYATSTKSSADIIVPCSLHGVPPAKLAPKDRKYLGISLTTDSTPPDVSTKQSEKRLNSMNMVIAHSVALTFTRALGCIGSTGVAATPDLRPLP